MHDATCALGIFQHNCLKIAWATTAGFLFRKGFAAQRVSADGSGRGTQAGGKDGDRDPGTLPHSGHTHLQSPTSRHAAAGGCPSPRLPGCHRSPMHFSSCYSTLRAALCLGFPTPLRLGRAHWAEGVHWPWDPYTPAPSCGGVDNSGLGQPLPGQGPTWARYQTPAPSISSGCRPVRTLCHEGCRYNVSAGPATNSPHTNPRERVLSSRPAVPPKFLCPSPNPQ